MTLDAEMRGPVILLLCIRGSWMTSEVRDTWVDERSHRLCAVE